ncbi:MAG: amidohydrolase family protein [Planctomycetota bacterium]
MSHPINPHDPIPAARPDRPTTYRIDALAAADATGLLAAPASVMVHVDPLARETILARPGTASSVVRGRLSVRVMSRGQADSEPADGVIRVHRPADVILPGLVNAHTHLDLTSVGPLESARGNFPVFIDHVRANRPGEDSDIEASVARGVELCLAGGVVAVGDIAGAPRGRPSLTPFSALSRSPLQGVSFLEFFGIGLGEDAAWDRLLTVANSPAALGGSAVRLGLQPHAPYSVSPRLHARALALASERRLPICTHLAESPAEHEFIAHATGPQRRLLESIGLWTPDLLADVGRGKSPVEHLARWLSPQTTAVHLNDVSDQDLAILTQTSPRVIYCPRSSAYFDAPAHFGPHRYREMLGAGLTVALGTDSILNLPESSNLTARGGISTLDEMRLLFRRDATPSLTLLAMATTHGAGILHLPEAGVLLSGGSPMGVIAVPARTAAPNPLDGACLSDDPAELLFLSN